MVRSLLCGLAWGSVAAHGHTEGKYQVLMPKPHQHSTGKAEVVLGASELQALAAAAKSSDEETQRVVEAQFLSRLPEHRESDSGSSSLQVEFLHALPAFDGASSWQPTRERNETYGLYIGEGKLIVDAQTHWALANAMSTLYQLTEIKRVDGSPVVKIPNSPHDIADSPAFPHRGLSLDTSRTFFPVSWMKGLIEQLGEFKLNVLHLHLTDTAAWSFEVEKHPDIAKELSYRDINGEQQTYSRKDLRELVEFARLRGVSLEPEVDGPVHAPTMASAEPLKLTVDTDVSLTTDDWGAEPPVGTWNFSSPRVTGTLRDVFEQLEEDFVTAPYIHVGGDEPHAVAVCAALTDETQKAACRKQCSSAGGGTPYQASCSPQPTKPEDATETYWFPEVLNEKVQGYFDDVTPPDSSIPLAAWSGVREDMAVQLGGKGKPALQLWEFPQSKAWGLTEEDCQKYDIIQSSATHPLQNGDSVSDFGWLYLECGEGQNWISMGKDYWCSRAPWVAMYAMNITQHSNPVLQSETCQRAFVGAEIAIWGEITGPGNAMSLLFPRAAAFAERMWSNPEAVTWKQMSSIGQPSAQYWKDHLQGALHRLNAVVENFVLQGVDVARLQPKFCFDHPEYCDHYTEPFLPKGSAEAVLV
jgi:hexosaminidase